MPIQSWLIFTPEQNEDVLEINETTSGLARVIPRQIDNPLANNLGEGTLLGNFVAPASIIVAPNYSDFYALCSTLPIRTMDSDIIFAYVEPL